MVHDTMLQALFKACGAGGGGGLAAALEIFRDAKSRELLTRAQQESSVVHMIKWCKEDSTSFARIVSELREDEQDLSSDTRETLSYANALYSGFSDGYSGSA